jgi:hypothetical protein
MTIGSNGTDNANLGLHLNTISGSCAAATEGYEVKRKDPATAGVLNPEFTRTVVDQNVPANMIYYAFKAGKLYKSGAANGVNDCDKLHDIALSTNTTMGGCVKESADANSHYLKVMAGRCENVTATNTYPATVTVTDPEQPTTDGSSTPVPVNEETDESTNAPESDEESEQTPATNETASGNMTNTTGLKKINYMATLKLGKADCSGADDDAACLKGFADDLNADEVFKNDMKTQAAAALGTGFTKDHISDVTVTVNAAPSNTTDAAPAARRKLLARKLAGTADLELEVVISYLIAVPADKTVEDITTTLGTDAGQPSIENLKVALKEAALRSTNAKIDLSLATVERTGSSATPVTTEDPVIGSSSSGAAGLSANSLMTVSCIFLGVLFNFA